MTLKEYAYAYKKFGWNVIPLTAYSKAPTGVNWKELESRRITDEEIEKWFSPKNVTGIGVVTGKVSGIVVVDEDSYKANGMKFEFSSPMTSQTARGGKHHYFRYTEPIKTSGFRQGVNIEIKSDGGFIVLPPTKVKIDENNTKGSYEWIKKCKISGLPTITEEQLLQYRGNMTAGEAVHISELLNAPLGTQHNNLRTIANKIFNRFNQSEWDIAEELVRQMAAKFDPPHPEDRVDKMIHDSKQFILTNPKISYREEEPLQQKQYHPTTTDVLAGERLEDRKLEKIAPHTPWPELDKLIKGFIPGHLYTLTGDTNVGKTALAANITECLREQEKRVLYIALEPDVNIVEYLASVRRRKAFHLLADDELRITGKGNEYVDIFLGKDIASVDELIEAIETLKIKTHYDLIIIDHIGYFVNSENNYIHKQSNVIKQLAYLAKQEKMAVLMIAHLRKNKQKKGEDWIPSSDDISGSAAFKQDSTEVLIVVRDMEPPPPGEKFSVKYKSTGTLFVTKTKTGPNGQIILIWADNGALITSPTSIGRYPQEQQEYTYRERLQDLENIGNEDEDEWNDNND